MHEPALAQLRDALIEGAVERVPELTKHALEQGVSTSAIITDALKESADVVGEKYDNGEYFLPNLVRCGDSFKAAIAEVQGQLDSERAGVAPENQVVIASVEGDIHDIGKNLVVTFLQGDGYAVEDLGVNVPAKQLVDKAVELHADIIALSCLMSVTRDGVRKVCDELKARGLRDEVHLLVGGAATTEQWARDIGCDAWGASATDAPRIARKLVALEKEA